MENKLLAKKLSKGQTVYLFDDFEGAMVKFTFDTKEQRTRTYLKRKGQKPVEVPQSSKTVFEIEMGGKEVTSEAYDKY